MVLGFLPLLSCLFAYCLLKNLYIEPSIYHYFLSISYLVPFFGVIVESFIWVFVPIECTQTRRNLVIVQVIKVLSQHYAFLRICPYFHFFPNLCFHQTCTSLN